MSTLTSTITVSGTIAGRKINFSHEYTIENVYDAGQRTYGNWGWSGPYVAEQLNSLPPAYLQDTPTYLLLRNTSSLYPSEVTITGISGFVFWLWPNQTVIINSNTASSGTGNYTNGSGATTLLDFEGVEFDNINTGNYGGSPYAMFAFNAIS